MVVIREIRANNSDVFIHEDGTVTIFRDNGQGVTLTNSEANAIAEHYGGSY